MTIARFIARLVGVSCTLVAIGQYSVSGIMSAIFWMLIALFCVMVVR